MGTADGRKINAFRKYNMKSFQMLCSCYALSIQVPQGRIQKRTLLHEQLVNAKYVECCSCLKYI